MTIRERPVIDDRAYDNEVFGPLNFSGAMLEHHRAVAVAAVRALRWFADPRNYEDTLDRVGVLRGNIVWSDGLGRAKEALREIEESGWR